MTRTSGKNTTWLSKLSELRHSHTACVLITVIESKGSTPRNAETKMIITDAEQFLTIGGGNLEFQAIEKARELIKNYSQTPITKDYALGPTLAQCCGGTMTILLEPFIGAEKTLYLFGAGHVGKQVINVLSPLPIKIKWIDERENEFPDNIPHNVDKIATSSPVSELKNITDTDFVLIMTHCHDLDYDLTHKALSSNNFAYLGLIGSKTKKVKFQKRLLNEGITDDILKKLTCPIGITGITGKEPYEIALAVAAELLQLDIARPLYQQNSGIDKKSKSG